jgi:hypothetical protein
MINAAIVLNKFKKPLVTLTYSYQLEMFIDLGDQDS